MPKGFSTILIVVGIFIVAVVLLVPFPYYFNGYCDLPCPLSSDCCKKEGWYLGTSLWKQLASRYSQTSGGYTVKITPSPTPTPDETANSDLIGANWKTYTSKFQDYNLKYPSNWRLIEDDGGITLEPILKSKYIITISGPSVNSGESFEETIPRMQDIISKTDITIGKYTGIKLESEQTSKELNRYQRTTTIVFENLSSALAHGKPGDKGYLVINLEISGKSQVQEAGVMFNQILSTFKFLK